MDGESLYGRTSSFWNIFPEKSDYQVAVHDNPENKMLWDNCISLLVNICSTKQSATHRIGSVCYTTDDLRRRFSRYILPREICSAMCRKNVYEDS